MKEDSKKKTSYSRNNAIQEVISDTSKFKKFNEDPTLKHEASLQLFLRKLKHKNFFNENKYDKLYPSGSAPTRIYGTLKMHKFSSVDSFTNIPLQETTDIAKNLIFNHNPNLSITK